MKNILLIAVISSALYGCSSMSTKIKQQQYSSWPTNIQRAVDSGTIIPGMNKWQVLAVTDVPESLVKKRTHFSENGVRETWILYKSFGSYYFSDTGLSSTVIISFSDGVVSSVSF